jgi:hypothetical protein
MTTAVPPLAASITWQTPQIVEHPRAHGKCFPGFGAAGSVNFFIDPVVSHRVRFRGYGLRERTVSNFKPVGGIYPDYESAMYAAELRRREHAKASLVSDQPQAESAS